MTKRKAGSYLGGHTVITLHPKIVEAGIREQAQELKKQQQEDQRRFDESRACQEKTAERIARKNRAERVPGVQGIHHYYKDQIHLIDVLLKGKPNNARTLVSRKLDLLEKWLNACEGGARRKIIRRMNEAERHLNRLQQAGGS
jgi:hypothetical protein